MLRQVSSYGVRGARLGVLVMAGSILIPAALAQTPPPTSSPTSQPATQPTTQPDALQQLMELRDHPERIPAKPAKSTESQPAAARGVTESRPAERPVAAQPAQPAETSGTDRLEELRRRAEASTQQAASKPAARGAEVATADEDDFVGPPYPPATPPELLKTNGHNGEATRPAEAADVKPEARPGGKSSGEAPVSHATGEKEWFNFDHTPWEDVIRYFASRIGKPIMDDGSLVIGGDLTYISDRPFTKDEALDELNFIMLLKGYRFVETEHHIFVVPLNELSRRLEPKDVYSSREEFEHAPLRSMDFVAVYILVKDRAAAKVQSMFDTMLPDYMTIKAEPESNQLKVVGTVRDIRNLLTLMDRVKMDESDPREVRIFEVKTNARDVERLVRDMLGGSAAARPQATLQRDASGRMVPVPAAAPTVEEDVKFTSDDRTNTIIVKAIPAKLNEIGELIKKLDEKPDLGFDTRVVAIQNANAVDVADTLNRIFQTEQGSAASSIPQWQRIQAARNAAAVRGRTPPGQPPLPNQPTPMPMPAMSPEELLGEASLERAKKTIRLAADERTNSLIVYANKEGHERVEKLLVTIDRVQPTNFRVVKLAQAKAEDIFQTVTQVVQNIASSGRGRGANIVLDDTNNQFYVFAEREQMQEIEQVIRDLDLPATEGERHVVELENLLPSRVASMLQPILKAGGGGGGAGVSGVRQPGGRMGGRFPMSPVQTPAATPSASASGDVQIIPLDEAQLLIVICPPDMWAKVEDTIKIWDDRAKTNTPHPETFAVHKGDPEAIIASLRGMYPNGYSHRVFGQSPMLFLAEPGAVTVYAIKAALEEVKPLIEALDRPDNTQIEILALANADATQLAQQLTQLFGTAAVVGPRRPGAGGAPSGIGVVIQAEPVTNSLIVQATPAELEKVKNFAMRMDQQQGTLATEQRFYGMKNAQPQEVANAIQNVFGGPTRTRGGQVASQVKAMVAGTQVIVEAPHEKFAAIEAFIKQIDDPKGNQMEVKVVKLAGCDVTQVAQTLMSTLQTLPPRPDRLQPRVIPDAMSESLIVSAPGDMMAKIDELVGQFAQNVGDVTMERHFYLIRIADANYVADQLRQQLTAQLQSKGQTIASRTTITVDTRQNQVIINGPKLVHPLAEDLIKVLDRDATVEVRSRTVALTNADATTVANTLRSVYQEKARREQQNKSYVPVSLTPDTLTNAVIIYGGDEADHKLFDAEVARIEASVEATDQAPVTLELKYADPNQVAQTINAMFGPKGGKNAQQDVQATVSNGMLVLKAPRKKLAEIRDLVAAVDAEDKSALQIKTYQLKVLNATQVAAMAQVYLKQIGTIQRSGKLQPGAFPEPATNTLIVIAPADQLTFIDALIAKLETSDGRLSPEARAYVLKNAKADQVARNVEDMLKAKVVEKLGESQRTRVPTSVFSDVATNRLIVYAPSEYHELAGELIRMIDADVESGEILHIVQLQQADATQLAQTLTQALAQGAGGKGPAGTSVRGARILADAGSNSLLIAGLPKDVAEVERYITELESKSEVIPELQRFQLQHANAEDASKTLEKLFSGGSKGGKGALDTVTFTYDEDYNTLMVTASKRKMRQVEAFVEQLDVAPPTGEGLTDYTGRQLYFIDVYRGDAFDIAWDVKEFFPPVSKGGPDISADVFGEYIKVRCRPEEYDRVVSAIREVEKHIRIENKVVVRPLHGNGDQLISYLLQRMGPDKLEVSDAPEKARPATIVETLYGPGEEPAVKQRQRDRGKDRPREREAPPPSKSTTGGPIRPFRLGLPASVALLGEDVEAAVFDQEPPATRPTDKPAAPMSSGPKSEPVGSPPAAPSAGVKPAPAASARPAPARGSESATGEPLSREKTRVVRQPDGSVIIYGPKGDVEEVEKALDLLEEDITVGEVIRIFEFQYGDVTAAAEVINIMFNDRQAMLRLQQPQQPQPQPGQGQPGQRRGGGPGGAGGRDSDERDQGGMMEQLRQMVGGRQQQPQQGRGRAEAGGQRVRIATDPGHNYLIVKCQENDLPEIRQLLRELDIPPGEVELKVFQLKNLDATDTADNISEVLGINKAQQRRSGAGQRRAQGPMAPGQNPQQQQLMEMLQQQMVSVQGVEGGAKVERVEIVPNALTNALMVSAPPEVMKLIENVIEELESLEGRDIIGIYHYPLQRAKVDDVLPLLQEVFSAVGAGGGGGGAAPTGGGRPGRTSRSGSPGAFGPVTISGDPRTNTIIFTAEKKDIPAVEAQINLLDVDVPMNEAETYICRYGDATSIAAVVEQIFASTRGGGGEGPRPRGGGSSSGQDVRIVAEPTSNVIVVWGPLDKRDLIMGKIAELDERNKRDFREIDVQYGDPEKLADILLQMFSGSAGAGGAGATPGVRPSGRLGGRSQRMSGTAAAGVTIIGDKNAKKLMVRAPDPIFLQIEKAVETLDVPNKQMDVRRFALKHADAEFVVEAVKNALTELVVTSGASPWGGSGGEMPYDPFTAVADPRTNSVLVVGSQQTFAFVENLLRIVDVETPEGQRKDFRVYVLDKADAEVVAEAINNLAAGETASGGTSGASRTSMSGRRPGRSGMFGMPTATPGRELNVYAVADAASRTVMVFGRPEDIDVVEQVVINRLEDKIRQNTTIETIAVKEVKPTEIVGIIQQMLSTPETDGGGRSGRGGGRSAAVQPAGPLILPNDNNNTLVVRGSRAEIAEVRDLVERFDQKGLMPENIKVVKVPQGQDVVRLASEVETIVNAHETEAADAAGRRARRITVEPDEYTKSLIIAGDAGMFGLATSIIDQLGSIKAERVVTRVIELRNLSSDDARQMIDELQGRARSSGTRSGASRTSTTPRPSMTTPRSSTPTPRSGTPRPSGTNRPSGGGGARPGGGNRPTGPGGDARWPSLRIPDDSVAPRAAGWLTPVIGVLQVRPGAAAELARELLSQDQEPASLPPAATPRRRPPPGTAPAATQPAGEQPPALLEEEPITGVSGELTGEVVCTQIDSKRIIVTGDEDDLDFIEHILVMMEQSTAPALIRVMPLKHAKATALAQLIEKAIKAQIDVTTRTPGPQDRFSINAEGRSNSLIVSASETIMQRIEDLVAGLDVEKPPTGFRSVPLKFVRAAEAVTMLRPIVEKLAKIGDVPTESQASIEALDRSNSVLIVGTEGDIDEIEQMIKSIDIEVKTEETSFVAADVVLVQLQNGVADDIAKTLTTMIEEQQKAASQRSSDSKTPGAPFVKVLRLRLADGRELPELNLERPIKVLAEKGTNSLIIFSSPKNNQALQEIVKVFDTLPVGADTEVKAIALVYANAEDVSKLLDTLFKDKGALKRPSEGTGKDFGKGELPPVPPSPTGKGLPYNVVVQHDARSNVVIVIGRKDAVVLAASLIAELDKPGLELGMRPHLVPLKNMSASVLSEKLTKFMDDRAKALGVDKNKARDNVLILPDDRSNALVVLATPDMFDLIQDLALELDTADSYRQIDTRFRRLEYADAQKLQGLLKEVFDKKKEAASKQSKDAKDSLDLVADTRSNSLILTGTRDYLTEADGMIDNLDQKFDPTVVFVVRPVKLNSATNIAALLKDVVDKALKEQDSKLKGTPIYVAADPISDSLLMAASQEDMNSLERWVEALDRPSEIDRMTRIIPLKRASADDLAKSASTIFKSAGGGGTSGKAGIDVSITSEPSSNSVVIFAPPAMIPDIEDFVRRVDETGGQAGTVVRIFKLKQADAQDAGNLITNILELRSGSVGGTRSGSSSGSGGRKETAKQIMLLWQHDNPEYGTEWLKAIRADVAVISELRTNSLVVAAPAESMPLLESLVAAIDVPPDAAKVRSFKLYNSDAEQMVKMLEELFAQKQAGSRTTGSSTGSEDKLLTLGEGLGGEGGRQEISFTKDVRTNSVIAAGTPGYLDLVQDLILQLDTQPIEEYKTMVYSPRYNTADVLQTALSSYSDKEKARVQELGQDISLSVKQEREILAIASKEANRVIIGYSPRREAEVLNMVRELDQPPPQVSIEVLIVEVTTGNSLELGVEFAGQDLQYTKAGPNDTTTFDYVGGTDVGAAGSGLGGFTFTITGRDFNFLLRTLQSENSLNVLSRPHIVAMDNQEANIEITQNVPRVGSSTTTSTGQVQTSVTSENVGIKLKVTPQINPDGYVRMKIRQEVSDVTDSSVTIAPGVTAPIFFQRITETNVTIHDNETVVLGGLIQSRDSKTEQKIPLVGDIPLIGPLFRFQRDEQRRSELLVILTPRVIRTTEDYRALSAEARDQTGLIPDDVKANPLMRNLQIKPEDVVPLNGENGATEGEVRPEGRPEEYGPVRPSGPVGAPKEEPPDANSYDVPVGRLSRR